MKKVKILPIAILCTLFAANAQNSRTFNIERVYKHMTTLNGNTQSRQGVFANGKFYLNNYAEGQIEIWDQEGQQAEVIATGSNHPAITADQAGNIIIANPEVKWPAGSDKTRYYRIYPGGNDQPVDLSITYDGLREPESEGGFRSDYLGPIEGDIMSAEGGTLVTMVCHRPVINVARIANGIPAENFSIWVDTAYVGGNIVCNIGYGEAALRTNWKNYVGAGAAYSQTTCYKYGDEYVVSKNNVGLKGFTFLEDSLGTHAIETNAYRGKLVCDYTTVYDPNTSAPDQPVDAFKMSGDRLFELGGRLCVIKHVTYNGISSGSNAFAIADDATGKILGLWYGLENGDVAYAGEAAASWFTVVPISDTQAEIYQYFPASGKNKAFYCKYIFTNDPSQQAPY